MEVEEKVDIVVKDSSGLVGECIGGEIGTDRLLRIGQRHAFMAVLVMIRKASLDKQLMVHTWPLRFDIVTMSDCPLRYCTAGDQYTYHSKCDKS